MKISVLTPSIRPEGLDIAYKCLKGQDFDPAEFEWIIVGNQAVVDYANQNYTDGSHKFPIRVFLEREKRDGDFYNLTKSFNDVFKNSEGELGVMLTDMTWITPDTLSRFWDHYQTNAYSCVGGIGHQYETVEMNKPQIMVWRDPRARMDFGSFYEIQPIDFEMCLASIPVKAWKDAGGFDEDFDQVAALGEKDLAIRMDKLGYKFFLDQSMEYRAVKHPRLSPKWEEYYQKGCKMFEEKFTALNSGTRPAKLKFI